MNIQVFEGTIVSHTEHRENIIQHMEFEKLYDRLNLSIPFNPNWNNGTGYLDHITTDRSLDDLSIGLYKSTDDIGRRIIIVKGNAISVIFERYPEASIIKKVVLNTPYRYSGRAARVEQEEKLGYAADDHTNPSWNVVDVIRYLLGH
jgi:hypothetical protein